MDGGTSTKKIREHEKKSDPHTVPEKHMNNGRIPIIAVSASLVESRREEYMVTGFDGWILKPIDFKRLGNLLGGIHDEKLRLDAAYEQGQWERGGWFEGEAPRKQVAGDVGDAPDVTAAAVAAEGDFPGDV